MSTNNNFIWKEEYTLGNKYIDEQHQKIFEIAQQAEQLHTQETAQKKKIELRRILHELFAYINYHFESEENFMRKVNYPMLDEHLKLHKSMKDQLNYINFNLLTINIDEAEEKLVHFIQKVFVAHIMQEDLKVINFSNK